MKAGSDNCGLYIHMHIHTLKEKEKITQQGGTTLRNGGLGTSYAWGIVGQPLLHLIIRKER